MTGKRDYLRGLKGECHCGPADPGRHRFDLSQRAQTESASGVNAVMPTVSVSEVEQALSDALSQGDL